MDARYLDDRTIITYRLPYITGQSFLISSYKSSGLVSIAKKTKDVYLSEFTTQSYCCNHHTVLHKYECDLVDRKEFLRTTSLHLYRREAVRIWLIFALEWQGNREKETRGTSSAVKCAWNNRLKLTSKTLYMAVILLVLQCSSAQANRLLTAMSRTVAAPKFPTPSVFYSIFSVIWATLCCNILGSRWLVLVSTIHHLHRR